MPDIFDTLDAPAAASGDVFDSIDIFDELQSDKPVGMIDSPAEISRRFAAQQNPERIGPGGYPTDPGTGLVTAIGEEPAAFVKALPGMVFGAAAAPGKLAYYTAADLLAAGDKEGGREYGGNLRALMTSEDLPADRLIAEVAKFDRAEAVKANLFKALPELASMMAVNPPGAAGRLLAAGFSADMILHAQPMFEEYAAEINKPPEQQDAGRRAELEAGIIQTFTFAPLAGGHAARSPQTPGAVAGRMLGREVKRTDLVGRESARAEPLRAEASRPPADVVRWEDFTPAEPALAVKERGTAAETTSARISQAKTPEQAPLPPGPGSSEFRVPSSEFEKVSSTPEVEASPTRNVPGAVRPSDVARPAEAAAAAPEQSLVEPTPVVAQPGEVPKKMFARVIGESRAFPVESLADAARKFSLTREMSGVGASAMPSVELIDATGNRFARISYNGKIWDNNNKLLYDPFAEHQPAEAVAKVQEHVAEVASGEKTVELQKPTKKTKAETGPRPAKEIKSELVERLEEQVASAKSEADYGLAEARATYDKAVEKGRGVDLAQKSFADSMERAGVPKVTIEIPGDGTFSIWNTKEALGQVLERAKKLTTSTTAPQNFRRQGMSKEDALFVETQREAQGKPEQDWRVTVNMGNVKNHVITVPARTAAEAELFARENQYVTSVVAGSARPWAEPVTTGGSGLAASKTPGTSGVGFPLQAPAAAPVPPTPTPAVAPGTTMIQHGFMPVTLPRTGEGSVSVPQIMQSLVAVQRAAGTEAGNIRTGRFLQRALGIFKPHEEIIRLGAADDLPTATHEVGHALQKQLYGTSKASGLKVLPGDVRRELQGMGKALYGSRKPSAGYTGEGFAEFMRYWLSTDDAAKVAPKTTAFFEQQVLPKYPDVAEALKNSRGLLDVWRAQGSVERAQRQLVREPGAFARVARALGSLVTYQAQVESAAPLKAVSEAAARKLGKPLPPAQDPYKLFSFKRGSAGATVERMVMNHMLDVWGNPVGPSLSEALAPIKGRRKEFGLYVFARAAEQRWQQGKNPGIALEDAQHIKALYDSPEFRLAAQKYKDWQNGLLDYVVQADPSMADAVANMRGANDFYAPLARLIDPVQAKRAAANASSNPFMRMHGSGLPVKDIFDQTIINAARLVNRANRAMVTQAVVKTAQIPGLGHLIEEVPRARVMEKVNIEKLRDQLEAMGVDTSRRPGPNNTVVGIPDDHILQFYSLADMPKGSDPIVAVKDASGMTRWFQVDPRLYETLDGLQTFSLKNSFPNLPGLGAALDLVISAPGRMFKLGVTGLRAPFSLITNPARDLPTALVQSSVNPARFAAEYPAALGAVLRSGFGGKEGPGVQQFYDLGAHMGQPLGIDIGHTKRVSNELFHGRFLRTVLNPVDHLRQLFSITEAAPRVAELRALANEIGWQPGTKMTPDQATQLALAAKQVTVDFSAMGDVSRVVNSAVPFYNPAIQGLRSFGRAFQEHPVRSTLMGLAVFTVPALINWWRNKDKEWYQALPWRERYTYTNIDDGQNVWRIPRPFDWGNAFMVMPEAALDSWYRHDPRAATEALGHIFETQNPLDYPVLLKIAKEQWQNRIAHWNRPIVPRSEVDLPPAAQVGPYTSKVAIGINKAFPNVSPRRVDAALRGYFGGVYSDLIGGLGLTASQVDREWETSDLPVLGVLFRRGGEFTAQNQNISDFYDAYIPAQAKLTAAQQRMKRGPGQGNPITLSNGDLAAAQVGEQASKAITTLLRLANGAKETKARSELYRAANEIALQANTVIKNAHKPGK